VWSAGALVVAEGPVSEPDTFIAYNKLGQTVFKAHFSIPEAAHTYIRGYSRAADGTLALCGASFEKDGHGGPFIAVISPDGRTQKVVHTAPYTPEAIILATDGTLWTVGRELNESRSEGRGVNLNAGVLRQFDHSGKPLASFVPRSSIADPSTLSAAKSVLAAAGARVGWLRFKEDGQGAYVEVTSGGKLTVYPPPALPAPDTAMMIQRVALTDAGDVFASAMFASTTAKGAQPSYQILRLDRGAKQWRPLSLAGALTRTKWAMLYGGSGSELAMRLEGDSASTVRFYSPAR
jgi:hypothetical protein